MTARPASRAPLAMACLALAAAVALAFAPVAWNGFVTYDDPDYLTDNAMVQAGLTARAVGWAFTTFHAGNWHPLAWLGHLANVQLFGLEPAGHHLASLLVHVVNTLLVLLLLRRMGGSTGRSAAVALLFGLHPLRVESVAWAAELKDLLCALFFLLAVISYLGYGQRRTVGRYLAVAACTVLALLGKPMAVTLPALLLLLDWWPLGRFGTGGPGTGRLLLEKLPLALLSAGAAAVTMAAQRGSGYVNELDRTSLVENAGNALLSYAAYLGKLFWPVGLAIQYPFSGESVTPGRVAAAGLLLLAVTGAAVWRRREQPYLAFGWAWYLGLLVPVIGIVSVGSHAMADRYTYLPSLGICLMLVWGLADLAEDRPRLRAGLATAFALAALALGAATWRQVGVWHDSATLYRHALRYTAGNWFAHNNLGAVLARERAANEAFYHLSEAVRLNPAYAEAHYNLGNIYLYHLNNGARAIQCYQEALRLAPRLSGARLALAKAYLASGQWPAARAEYGRLLAEQPALARQLAELMERMGGGERGNRR